MNHRVKGVVKSQIDIFCSFWLLFGEILHQKWQVKMGASIGKAVEWGKTCIVVAELIGRFWSSPSLGPKWPK